MSSAALGRLGSPVLRYRTGDLVKPNWGERCECGSWELTLEGGIVSRVDDMVSIRGVNVYPSGVDKIVRAHDGIAEYRVEIKATHGMEEMHLKLEPKPGADGEKLAREVATELRSALSLRVPVSLVEQGSLPRFEFKARRWIRESGASK